MKGGNKEIGSFKILKHAFAIVSSGYGIAERASQTIEEGGLQQEGLDMLRLTREHFCDQVISHMAVPVGDASQQLIDILPVL
jgi:hypothetical protein